MVLPSNGFKKWIKKQAPRFCVSFGVEPSHGFPGALPNQLILVGPAYRLPCVHSPSKPQETQDASTLTWQPHVLLESKLFPCFCSALHPGLWFPSSWLLPGAEWLLDLQSGKQGRWREKDKSLISQRSHFFLSAFSQLLSSTSVCTSLVRTWTQGHARWLDSKVLVLLKLSSMTVSNGFPFQIVDMSLYDNSNIHVLWKKLSKFLTLR